VFLNFWPCFSDLALIAASQRAFALDVSERPFVGGQVSAVNQSQRQRGQRVQLFRAGLRAGSQESRGGAAAQKGWRQERRKGRSCRHRSQEKRLYHQIKHCSWIIFKKFGLLFFIS
jgi:hypothetical protein